ncbi:MAG: PQQ-dependent sugar dehydrogenase [Anaerolineales bacterium]|nr:PQQ-dependent sugar dehydrogenase [Anaerolineales bacterium]
MKIRRLAFDRVSLWPAFLSGCVLLLSACAALGSAAPTATSWPTPGHTPVVPPAANMFDPSPAGVDSSELPIELPPGFEISLFAINVPNARSLARGPGGAIFVGSRTAGNLYALLDLDGDFQADEGFYLGRGMNSPNGVAVRDGALYVAEINRVLRYDNIETSLTAPPEPVVVNDSFPTNSGHGWKFIRFGPDGNLYVPVGAPCNICDPAEETFGTIHRMRPDGSGLETYAHGIRNSVGFDWHPETGELWFTDNGADGLGDDLPPDELNHAPRPGFHFGFPHCHGGTIPDEEFGADRECDEFRPPAMALGPHVAALGMRFYTGDMFPDEYRNQIFIAEHGSWNRREPIGYRIMLVRLDGNQAVSYDVFAEGWLQDGTAWGRPVDLLQLPDGSLLVSDDAAGAIYRIRYEAE